MRKIVNPSTRPCIPLMVQRQPIARRAPRPHAVRVRILSLALLVTCAMSAASLASAQSRTVSDEIQSETPVELGFHAKRCVEMAMGHSVRKFAFEAAVRSKTIDPFQDQRLAADRARAKARCHAAFETARDGAERPGSADRQG